MFKTVVICWLGDPFLQRIVFTKERWGDHIDMELFTLKICSYWSETCSYFWLYLFLWKSSLLCWFCRYVEYQRVYIDSGIFCLAYKMICLRWIFGQAIDLPLLRVDMKIDDLERYQDTPSGTNYFLSRQLSFYARISHYSSMGQPAIEGSLVTFILPLWHIIRLRHVSSPNHI